MTQPPQAKGDPLPPGVRLSQAADGTIELTIRAADADELAWRVHDVVELIQAGRLARLVGAGEPSAE